MKTKTAGTGWVEATETFVHVADARPVEYQKRIVRDNHTRKLAEIDIHELPPLDPGSEGRTFVVAKGELYLPDDEIVQRKPQHFRPTTRTP